MHIFIARYGVREFGLKEFEGPFDMCLSPDGVRQAGELAECLKTADISVIIASPFRRATRTAHIVAEILAKPVFIEQGVTEWLTPSLVGYACYTPPSAAELAKEFHLVDDSYVSVLTPSFPETEDELLLRTKKVVELLAGKFAGKNILIVSHAPCDLGFALALSGGSKSEHALAPYPLGGLFQFHREGDSGVWEMLKNGDTSHMSGEAKAGMQAWMLPCLEH